MFSERELTDLEVLYVLMLVNMNSLQIDIPYCFLGFFGISRLILGSLGKKKTKKKNMKRNFCKSVHKSVCIVCLYPNLIY